MYEYSVKEFACQRDNEIIYGLLYQPDVSGKRPVVIMSHGYNSSHSHMLDVPQALAARGVIVYCYDFCGGSVYSKSTGDSRKMSVLTEQADLRAVYNTISSLDIADRNRIYLYGESQGGFISAITAAENKLETAGLFLLYPALCIPDDWKDKADMPDEMVVMGLILSRRFYEEMPRYDLFSHLAQYKKPVHIFHGDADWLVNISYAKRAEESIPDCRLDVFAGEGHGFTGEARQKMIAMIIEDMGL